MTPQERQLIDDLFDRLSNLESAPRDPDAVAAISGGLRRAPNAVYPLVQTVLVQDEALKRANSRIQELEQAVGAGQSQRESGGFLDSMRERFGQGGQPRGSVPNVPPPTAEHRPVWNSGQAMQQMQPQPGSYGQGYGAPASPFGGGGSFLGTAAAAAAGMVGGSLLLNGIRSMMGGSHYGYADTTATNQGAASPWSDQSNSSLARDLGADDVGRSGQADHARAGAFDQASADQASNDDYDNNEDDMDVASDDYGNGDDGGDDGGSDYA